MVEWPDWSQPLVKGRWQATWSLLKRHLKVLDHEYTKLHFLRKPGTAHHLANNIPMVVVAASCCGDIFQWQKLGDKSGLRGIEPSSGFVLDLEMKIFSDKLLKNKVYFSAPFVFTVYTCSDICSISMLWMVQASSLIYVFNHVCTVNKSI